MTSVDIYEGSCGRSEHRRTKLLASAHLVPVRLPHRTGDAPTHGDPVTVLASPTP